MDQLERIGAAIVTAINKVNRSIQKTQTYLDANTYSLGEASAIDATGISGALASTKILMEFVGEVDLGVGDAIGVLNAIMELVGEVDLSAGDTIGVLNAIMELVGEVDLGVAGADGTLRDVTRYISSSDAVEAGDADGSLDSQPGLVGSITDAFGNALASTLS